VLFMGCCIILAIFLLPIFVATVLAHNWAVLLIILAIALLVFLFKKK
jgi:hypothetical protein